jgi:hypothetical protein
MMKTGLRKLLLSLFIGALATLACTAAVAHPLLPVPKAAGVLQEVGNAPIKEKWTATSRLYQGVGPNKFILDASVGAWNYKAPWKGVTEWTEIVPGWEAAVAPWEYQSAQAEYDVKAVTDITAGQVVEWCRDAACIALQPMALNWTNALDQIQQISMPSAASVFFLEETTLGWDEAYGRGLQISFRLGNTQLREELRIDSWNSLPPPAAFILDGGAPVLELNFVLDVPDGLDLWVDGQAWDKKTTTDTPNAIEFRGANGTAFYALTPTACDSDTEEPECIKGVLRLKKQGGSLYISKRIDYSWLTAATYPVTIDPPLDLQVGAETDDAWRRLTTSAWDLTNDYNRAGAWDGSFYAEGSGMRFTGVAIGQGDTIDVAYITITARISDAGTVCNTRITAEDVDDAATFADDSAAFDARYATHTTAVVDWDAIASWTAESEYNSPSTVSVVQELVDRVGWSSGNDMVFFWQDFDNRSTITSGNPVRRGYSYKTGSTKAPKFHVEFTAAGGARRIFVTE